MRNNSGCHFDLDAVSALTEKLLAEGGCDCSREQLGQLCRLVELLHAWNSRINLTAVRNPLEMVTLHIMDSASVLPYIRGRNIADAGTGAGFPGMVLAVLCPEKNFTLIDSGAKKISFVRNACTGLKLDNVTAVRMRCEDFKPPEKFDCVVSRAFAPLDKMLAWCWHLVGTEGIFVAMKGHTEEAELKSIPANVIIEQIAELKVPGLNASRQAVIIRKA